MPSSGELQLEFDLNLIEYYILKLDKNLIEEDGVRQLA